MTRSASPNGAIEFSYDFPFASTSALPPTPTYPRRQRHRSPAPIRIRPQWEDDAAYDNDEEDLERDGDDWYARRGNTLPVPIPTRTGNQWRAPSPSPNPYAAYYPGGPSSYESTSSALSAASKRNQCHFAAPIHVLRKPRRSVDEPRPASPLPITFSASTSSSASGSASASSAPSSPYSLPEDDFPSSPAPYDAPLPDEDVDDDAQESDDEQTAHPHHDSAHMALKKQWTALSLRVRFGVFRAKRKMRNRVLSL